MGKNLNGIDEAAVKSSSPIKVVRAIVFSQGNVLLVERGEPPEEGRWCLPGGKVNGSESLEAAVRREVSEEVGLDFFPHQFSLDSEERYFIHTERGGNGISYGTYYFRGVGFGMARADGREVSRLLWLPILQILERQDLAFYNNGEGLRNVLHSIEYGTPRFPLAVGSPLPVFGAGAAAASHRILYN